MTQNPVLINPNRGSKNQNNGSCEPSKRSFFVKSIADSVAFPLHRNKLDELVSCADEVVIANDVARKVRASRRSGKDDLRQISIDSVKVIKTPGSNQHPSLNPARIDTPLSSYIWN